MRRRIAILLVFLVVPTIASSDSLRVKVEANEDVDDVVKNLRKQLQERSHTLDVVYDGTHEFRVIGVTESSFSGAQGTLLVLNNECEVLVAVTRSGRMTTGGAYNAAAKELVKRLESIGVLGSN